MGIYLGSSPISLYLGGQSEGEDIQSELTEQEELIQQIEESLVGKAYGANATPETIAKGYSAYVNQNLVEGTLEVVSGIDYGEIVVPSQTTSIIINHKLGSKAKSFIMVSEYIWGNTTISETDIVSVAYLPVLSGKPDYVILGVVLDNKQVTFGEFPFNLCPVTITDSSVTMSLSSGGQFHPSRNKWFVLE